MTGYNDIYGWQLDNTIDEFQKLRSTLEETS